MPITSMSTWNNFGQSGNTNCVCPTSNTGVPSSCDCVSNPYTGTFKATDFATDNISSVDTEITDKVSKTELTTQTLAGDLNLPSININSLTGTNLTENITGTKTSIVSGANTYSASSHEVIGDYVSDINIKDKGLFAGGR